MTTESEEWLARISRIAPSIDRWFAFIGKHPVIGASSVLAQDDARYPYLQLKATVWHSMAVSIEHEYMFVQCLRATKTTFPTSYLTVLRTALMAASHATWILGADNSQVRLTRALQLRADDLNSQRAALNGWPLPKGSALEKKKANELARLADYECELSEIAAELGMSIDVSKYRANHTGIIQSVAKDVYGDDRTLVSATEHVWRTGSSAAHGQRYFAASRYKESGAPGEATLSGKLLDIGSAAVAATMTTSHALGLFDSQSK